jgi:hypothetical protein
MKNGLSAGSICGGCNLPREDLGIKTTRRVDVPVTSLGKYFHQLLRLFFKIEFQHTLAHGPFALP